MKAYLDCAASSPPKQQHLAEFTQIAQGCFANPSSPHLLGRQAQQLLQDCRQRCLTVLGAEDAQAVFCASATEANNLVISSLIQPQGKRALELLSGPQLHPSLQEPLLQLARFGCRNRALGLDRRGQIDFSRLAAELQSAGERQQLPAMVVLNAVDGESGQQQPLAELAGLLARSAEQWSRRIWLHVDAVQWVPRLPLPPCPWQSLVVSGHKIGAVRGVALLLLRRPLQPLYRGGGQEAGLRAGTENLAAIVNFTRNLEGLAQDHRRLGQLHQLFLARLQDLPPCYQLDPPLRSEQEGLFAPGLLALRHQHLPGEVLLRMLDERGVVVGSGSACRQGQGGKKSPQRIRISFAASSEPQEIEQLIAALQDIARN